MSDLVSVLDIDHNPTATDEMIRLMEVCTEIEKENAAMRTALNKIAERTGDDPCRALVRIARDALRSNALAHRSAGGASCGAEGSTPSR
jgi:hypothetical protein